ncbi:MAG TPA: hypothetical protein VJW51_14485 [Candidatus Acidoferrales bacterium]|nr:hypothetical protein [Candidatus Acidoferrales bacterium]
MNRGMLSLTVAILLSAGALEALGRAMHPPATAAQPQQAPSCSAPEYRQFDFWAGDWDAFEGGNPAPVARVLVGRILDGCALHEDYRDTTGHEGESFSIYDASRKLWHQTWVTNRGQLLTIEGSLQSGEMILSGPDPSRGPRGRVRGVWKPAEGGVREIGVTSTDGGQSWKPWFDLSFRPHAQ